MSGGGTAPRRALVAAADAGLRSRAFDLLAARGWRVDAVGDALAVSRRLAKDRYELVITDTLEIPALAGTRVVRVDTSIDATALDRAIGRV